MWISVVCSALRLPNCHWTEIYSGLCSWMYTTLTECDQPKNKLRIRIDLGFWIFFGLYLPTENRSFRSIWGYSVFKPLENDPLKSVILCLFDRKSEAKRTDNIAHLLRTAWSHRLQKKHRLFFADQQFWSACLQLLWFLCTERNAP